MELQNFKEQTFFGVDDHANAFALQRFKRAFVHIVGQRVGNGAGNYERIARAEFLEFREKFIAFGVADFRTLPVDFGFHVGFDFDVNARKTSIELYKIVGGVEVAQLADNFVAREACKETHCRGFVPKVAKHD